jgi:aspartate/methionine/tyrosine aminotransferase
LSVRLFFFLIFPASALPPPHPFSSRLPTALDDNPLAQAVAARRAAGAPLLDLTLANPTQAGLDYPTEDLAVALAEGAAAPYAPDPRGLPLARAAVAQYYQQQHRAEIDPEHLHLTASTSEAYGFLFKLLGEPGAEILAPRPSYPLIAHLAALEGWQTNYFALFYESECHWRIDLAALAAALTPATRAVALIHPHNPTGGFLHPDDAAKIMEFCAAKKLALIVDEVFLDYPAPGWENHARTTAARTGPALTFTLGGLSKSCGLPHLKLAWIHTGGPVELAAAARTRLDFISDAYLNVATPVQAALPQFFALGAKIRAQIQRRIARNYLTLSLAKWPEGFGLLPRDAGWSALLLRPAAPDEETLALQILDRTGVLAHPGYFFDFDSAGPGYHALSLLPDPMQFQLAAGLLREWLPKLV